MNDQDRFGRREGGADDFERRFFRRQRAEVLAKIEAHEAGRARRRTAMRAALPLAAMLVLGALAIVRTMLPTAGTSASGSDWLFAWDPPAASALVDPLAAYEPDGAALAADQAEARGAIETAEADPTLLLPLFDDIAPDAPALGFDQDGAADATPDDYGQKG